ncbi:MAG TPA: SDR family NAD(P)-dependent oxidoreductase [Blastococcus sp.]|jgi:NAD(P)-dependent dehydrogenase (short-subunit alcohol dehydrogenase family)|nr:SDR family NAD(P)-dependent oxidoreductase [Blastococcus sp.]
MTTSVVTGGGRGLGRAVAEVLAGAGHRVVLVARTREAAGTAVRQIRTANPAASVEPAAVDLSSMAAIRAFAPTLSGVGAIDVLFHIAGVLQTSRSRRVTGDGYEETLAVNALAPFLLTALLLPALERSAAARVVTVSSRLHLPGSRGAPVDFDFGDPHLVHGYHPDRAYKNSKLAVLWFTYELQRRLPPRPVTANAVCPGFVPATAAASTTGAMHWLMRHVLPHMPFATSVAAATDALAFMALDPSLEGVGGKFYAEKHPMPSSAESYDRHEAERFWALAARLTGVDAP